MGRDAEIHHALDALEDSAYRGVVLVGDSGVGKSTLARHLAAISSRGTTVRYVLATETGRAVPLSAFYWLTKVDASAEPAVMLAAAQRALERERNLLIVVDDAELLDPLSAALVYRLAARDNGRLIVTIGAGTVAPATVTALWKEGLLLRLDIGAFTRGQTEELVHAVLGDTFEPRLINELQRRTVGNPLLLRGLLDAGRQSGALVCTDHGWQLDGPLRPDLQLDDLIASRLQFLTAEESEAVELIAAAEVMDWEILRGLCDADAVAHLERRGLIQLVADESHTVARLMHPVVGDAIMQLAGVVRSRQLNGMLAQQLRKYMQAQEQRSKAPDVSARMALAQFMMRSDLDPDLAVIIDAGSCALATSSMAFAEKLGRFALDHGGGLQAALVLGTALTWQGRGDRAEAVLAHFDVGCGDEALAVRWACQRAVNLFFNCGDVEQAAELLADVRDRAGSPATAELITALDVMFTFFSGHLGAAIESGLALCGPDVLPLATAWAAAPTAYALVLAGRFDEADRVVAAGIRATEVSESGLHELIIGLSEMITATVAGNCRKAERVLDRYAEFAGTTLTGSALVEAMDGLAKLAEGALPSACAALHASISGLSRDFPPILLTLVGAWCTQAEGARGDCQAAAGVLWTAEESYGPHVAVLLPELELARAWERSSAGQPAVARAHAAHSARIAQESGMPVAEMRALHAGVRFGDRSCAARSAELAAELNTPLAQAIAAHAQGLADHDGDLLDAAADRFVALRTLAFAADAAAHAAAEHARHGERGKEIAASVRAYRLAGACDLRTGATLATARPLPITEREQEIATLVASGWSNRQIADHLVVSARTVDGHLQRIFSKLGINHRAQLTRLLDLESAGSEA